MSDGEFDYVVVGASSAGCGLASRLTEDPNVTVCLLEAGGRDTSVLIGAPAGYVAMVPTKFNNYAYQTLPQPGLNGRRGINRAARPSGDRAQSTRCSMCEETGGISVTGDC
jgi:choline dehydrogenase-like flavoprotein